MNSRLNQMLAGESSDSDAYPSQASSPMHDDTPSSVGPTVGSPRGYPPLTSDESPRDPSPLLDVPTTDTPAATELADHGADEPVSRAELVSDAEHGAAADSDPPEARNLAVGSSEVPAAAAETAGVSEEVPPSSPPPVKTEKPILAPGSGTTPPKPPDNPTAPDETKKPSLEKKPYQGCPLNEHGWMHTCRDENDDEKKNQAAVSGFYRPECNSEHCAAKSTKSSSGRPHTVQAFDSHDMQLLRCASKGDVARVKILLELKADVNYADRHGTTALYNAVARCNATYVESTRKAVPKKAKKPVPVRSRRLRMAAARDEAEAAAEAAAHAAAQAAAEEKRKAAEEEARKKADAEKTKSADDAAPDVVVLLDGADAAIATATTATAAAITTAATKAASTTSAAATELKDHVLGRKEGEKKNPAKHISIAVDLVQLLVDAKADVSSRRRPPLLDCLNVDCLKLLLEANADILCHRDPQEEILARDSVLHAVLLHESQADARPLLHLVLNHAAQAGGPAGDQLLGRLISKRDQFKLPAMAYVRDEICGHMLVQAWEVALRRVVPPSEDAKDGGGVAAKVKDKVADVAATVTGGLVGGKKGSGKTATKESLEALMEETWAVELNKEGDYGHGCERVRIAVKKLYRYVTDREYEYQLAGWRRYWREHEEWQVG